MAAITSLTAPALPVALNADLGARLQELLLAAARDGGPAALQAALADSAVHTLVLAVRLGAPPAASLVQTVRRTDPMAQWLDLSCI